MTQLVIIAGSAMVCQSGELRFGVVCTENSPGPLFQLSNRLEPLVAMQKKLNQVRFEEEVCSDS